MKTNTHIVAHQSIDAGSFLLSDDYYVRSYTYETDYESVIAGISQNEKHEVMIHVYDLKNNLKAIKDVKIFDGPYGVNCGKWIAYKDVLILYLDGKPVTTF